MQVHYPLIAGARITGTFELGEGVGGASRREGIQTLLFKVAAMALKPRIVVEEKKAALAEPVE